MMWMHKSETAGNCLIVSTGYQRIGKAKMKEQSSSHPLIRWWNACLVASHSQESSYVQVVNELILQANEDSDDEVALEACDSGLRFVNMVSVLRCPLKDCMSSCHT